MGSILQLLFACKCDLFVCPIFMSAVFTVTMVAQVELDNAQAPQKLVSTATIAVRVVAAQLVAQIAGGDRSFWCVLFCLYSIHTSIHKKVSIFCLIQIISCVCGFCFIVFLIRDMCPIQYSAEQGERKRRARRAGRGRLVRPGRSIRHSLVARLRVDVRAHHCRAESDVSGRGRGRAGRREPNVADAADQCRRVSGRRRGLGM
jgi:hypothetical protein